MSQTLTVTGQRVLLPDSLDPRPATLTIESGKIVAIEDGWRKSDIDAGSYILIAGLVDAHVHLNEPGRTAWEVSASSLFSHSSDLSFFHQGFWTGTRAAAAGGVTCVVDMPLNSLPPTCSSANLDLKRAAATNQCFTDVAFWGGVIPGNQHHLRPLVDAGVKGFKCFLIDSGVEEFPCVSEEDTQSAMEILQDLSTVLLFHAEFDHAPSQPAQPPQPSTAYNTFLQSRPEKLEVDAISLITRLQQRYPALRCHIVHLSAASALPVIRAAKAAGAKLTVETCFHYLCLAADHLPDGHPEFKCCPPIRDDTNRQLLWEALLDGTIDCVVSDHSPCVAELKHIDDGDIMGAWGGISTLGLGLSLLWTEGSKRGVSLAQILDWTSKKTAEHASLHHRKGALKVGFDADFVVWDPDAEFTVTKESLHFKNKLSAYEGLNLRGQVKQTYVRGSLVYDSTASDAFVNPPVGNLL
ncbi:Allantoinase [Mycena indigotica]|uniref:allantoinase n=1 Tax=Mycena indigotica TaxID=2126181 RepID=A0A8H6WKE2_9AGAR|nr:Allantoinase [Mycena indigotica]KAF7315639.1 Allantoinase [Mycena indigotica]